MSEQHDKDECAALREEIFRLRRRLNVLSSPLEIILKRRGFRLFSEEPAEDLLIPSKKFLSGFYAMLGKYSFRLFLRDVIKHQDLFTRETVTRYATAGVTGEYIAYLLSIRLIRKEGGGYALSRRHVKSFGETLEWYVAEIFRREFSAEAVRGVKFKRRKIGGDYDVIAKMDCSVCYVEVKSSPPKQIYDSEIRAFLERVDDLAPHVALFLMDTELRMKDKIVPMFEAELARRGKGEMKVERLEKELFHIGGRIYIINAKDSISGNIRNVLIRYFKGRDDNILAG
jgi:hypothetical protein